jgi:putative ABC transport system permease protein
LIGTAGLFETLRIAGTGSVNVWVVTAVFVVLVFGVLAWLLHTDFGIAMRATGSNEGMARALGVNTRRMKVTGLALANALTALSGYLVTQYQAYADINMGIGIVISGLASVIIGGSLVGLLKGRGIVAQLLGVIAGTIVFRLALAAALSAGLDPNYLKLMTSILVLAILAVGRTVGKEVLDD